MKRAVRMACLAAFVALHVSADSKPSGCAGPVCIRNLQWSGREIRGVLENNSKATFTTTSVSFPLRWDDSVTGTADAFLFAPLPPGARWPFIAEVLDRGMYSDMAVVKVAAILEDGKTGSDTAQLQFGRIWGPGSYFDRKRWEKGAAKRDTKLQPPKRPEYLNPNSPVGKHDTPEPPKGRGGSK